MGRTSKFSFPIPGRRHKEVAPVIVQTAPGSNLSKAQRILGTTSNLNIDLSPTREDSYQHWRHPGSSSSGMSISIYDSTSAESVHESDSDQWECESGVLPTGAGKSERPSSTLLSVRYADDDGIIASSERSGRLRNEDSSSTLKSFYDRQKAPLSVSQQTSASSARDQALRKGCPPVIQRSPLLQVEPALDPFDAIYAASGKQQDSGIQANQSFEKKKKPGRLDLTKLFPKSRRHGDKWDSDYLTPSPSSASTTGSHNAGNSVPESTRRKLRRVLSKESVRSQKMSIRSDMSHEQRQTNAPLLQLYDHYEHMLARSPRMDQIPESRVPDRIHVVRNSKHASLNLELDSANRPAIPDRIHNIRNYKHASTTSEFDSANHAPVPDRIHIVRNSKSASITAELDSANRSPRPLGSYSEKAPFSWKSVRSSLAAANLAPPGLPPSNLTPTNTKWDTTSVASVSSRNTRASKTTAGSSFTHSDLQEKSVLSLSDDSEDDSEAELGQSFRPSSRSIDHSSFRRPTENRAHSDELTAHYHEQRSTPIHQEAPHLTVPRYTTASSRLSGPWGPPPRLATPPSSQSHHSQYLPPKRYKKDRPISVASDASSYRAGPPSIASIQSSQAPYTPPLSPSSMMFRQTSERSNRFMAVTQQEEALLEALRQKRARMREEIIEEHETTIKTPPREPMREPLRIFPVTAKLSASTLRDPEEGDKNQTVLLYLDTPVTSSHAIEFAEPSPDLDGFLGFDSDDDSTPRTSWVPSHSAKPRPESFVAPLQRKDTASSPTLPSAARLSAVGASRGFKPTKSSRSSSKKRNTGVKSVKEGTAVALTDEILIDEEPMLWKV